MTQNQFNAFREMKSTGADIKTQHRVFLSVKRRGIVTLREIIAHVQANAAPVRESSITGALSTLMDRGLIFEIETGKFAVTLTWEQCQFHIEKRNRERKAKWEKLGHKCGWIKPEIENNVESVLAQIKEDAAVLYDALIAWEDEGMNLGNKKIWQKAKDIVQWQMKGEI